MARFLTGTVVVFEAAPGAGRSLATVTRGPNEDGSFDLDCRPRVRPECLRTVDPGEAVEYFSSSLGQWLPTKVVRACGRLPGTIDLECKEGADLQRVRLPGSTASIAAAPTVASGATQFPVPGAQRQALPTVPVSAVPASIWAPTPAPSAALGTLPVGTHQPPGPAQPAAGAGAAGAAAPLLPGERCFYKSSQMSWIPAQVVRFHPEDGTHDLDVKQRVRPDAMRAVREGDIVEYNSASAGQWITSRVVRRCAEPGIFDLECKEKVDMRRIRPKDDAPSAPAGLPATSDAFPIPLGSSPPLGSSQAPRPPADPVRQQAAKMELQRTRWGRNAAALQEAIRVAVEAGLPPYEVEPARQSLAMLQASADLQAACRGQSAQVLREAIKAATAAGLSRDDVEPAERALIVLETQAVPAQQAQAELQRAIQRQDIQALTEAIWQATSSGLPREALEPAERALAALKARQELQTAAGLQSPRRLRQALQQAATAGVPREDMDHFGRALLTLEAQSVKAEAARGELERAVQAQEPHALQAALQAGAAAGVPVVELERARRLLDALQSTQLARQMLRQAVATGGLPDLQAAIRVATQAGLAPSELEPAAARLHSLEADAGRRFVMDQVRNALEAEDGSALRRALDAAKGRGITGEEIDQAAQQLSSLEARPLALRELRRCMAVRDVAALQAALEAAAVAGVSEEELSNASRMLRSLEASQDQAAAREELSRALEANNPGALKAALQAAASAGIAGEELDQATRLLCDVESKTRAREGLRRADAAVSSSSDPAEARAALRGALRAAELAGLSESEVARAKSMLSSMEAPLTNQSLSVPKVAGFGHQASAVAPTQPQLQRNAASAIRAAAGVPPTQPQLSTGRIQPADSPPTQPQISRDAAGAMRAAAGLPGTQPQLQYAAAAAQRAAGGSPPTQHLHSKAPPPTQPQVHTGDKHAPPTKPQLSWAI